MMKLLLLADGRSAHTIRYQSAMKERGIDVLLASLERGDTVDHLLKKKSVSNSLNYFFVNREIKELVRKFNPDLVNPHFASGYGFSTAVSKVWKKKPVVLHCLGSDILVSPQKSFAHKRRVIYALERANMILTDSEYLKNQTLKLTKNTNIIVIFWGVEKEILDLSKQRKNIKQLPLEILVPRPHQKIYNNSFIVSSLKDLFKSGKIKITFPGWGDEWENFKCEVRQLEIENAVSYYPFMERKSYIDFMCRFEIYLSAAKSDSSPASLIEAMGAGMIPVVADIPGVREWADNSTAILYENDSPVSIQSALDELLDEEADFDDMLAKNHNRVKELAMFDNNIDQTLRLMEAMVADAK